MIIPLFRIQSDTSLLNFQIIIFSKFIFYFDSEMHQFCYWIDLQKDKQGKLENFRNSIQY